MRAAVEEPHTVIAVTEQGTGESIRQRRTALGMTVKALAERAGVDRGRLAAIEDGATARPSTVGAIERTLDRLEEEMGMDAPAEAEPRLATFDVSGEGGFHIVVSGPVEDADTLKRQVVDIILAMRKAEKDDNGG